MFLKPGANYINKNNLVAPRGFERRPLPRRPAAGREARAEGSL